MGEWDVAVTVEHAFRGIEETSVWLAISDLPTTSDLLPGCESVEVADRGITRRGTLGAFLRQPDEYADRALRAGDTIICRCRVDVAGHEWTLEATATVDERTYPRTAVSGVAETQHGEFEFEVDLEVEDGENATGVVWTAGADLAGDLTAHDEVELAAAVERVARQYFENLDDKLP